MIVLYVRIDPRAALDHPARQRLYAACMARDRGATVGDLAKETGLERKTAEHHLRYLARVGLLRIDTDAHAHHVFAGPATPRPVPCAPLAQRLLEAVRARPGASILELAAALGVTRRRLDRCAKRLLVDGRLQSQPRGRGRVLFLRASS